MLGLYAPLFVTLLLRVSCTVGVQLPKSLQSRERRSSSLGRAARSLHPARYGAAGAGGTLQRHVQRVAGANAAACAGETTPVITTVAPPG